MKESDELDKIKQELKQTLTTWNPENQVEIKRMKPLDTISLIAMLVFLIAHLVLLKITKLKKSLK